MAYDEIILEIREPLAFMTLNNPRKANALSKKMIAETIDALSSVAGDESVKVVVIRAAGKHFCAGHDLKEMTGGGLKEGKFIFDRCTDMMNLMHRIPQPVICQVHGIAAAAGCQLVAWSDLAVAAHGASFMTPGVKIGFFCGTPMVALTRAIGRKAAMEMLLTGRYFSAAEAKELGLVNRVVPSEELESETEKLALQIAESSRFVLAMGKQAFYAQVDQPDEHAMDYAKNFMAMGLAAEDAQNGIAAFLEKKKPDWKNR